MMKNNIDTAIDKISHHLKNLKIQNFRNLSSLNLQDLTRFNIFVGPNATGKTNVIEAIEMCSELSSFRHPVTAEFFPFDSEKNMQGEYINSPILTAQYFDNDEISLRIKENNKQYCFNGKKKKIVDIKGRHPAVVFTPDDLMLVKGSNSIRRKALDSLGSQLSKNYYTVRKDYSRTLKQKNALLKNGSDKKTIRAINEVMALPAAQMTCFRANLCRQLARKISDYYSKLSSNKEKISMTYVSDINEHADFDDEEIRNKVMEIFLDSVSKNQELEISQKRALIGPHRDKILFEINDKNAEKFASQGQQRSIVLAFKLAEVLLIDEILNQTPLLLMDDVMSELDVNRRQALLDYSPKQTQIFITTTNLSYFEQDILEKSNIIHLDKMIA